MKSPLVNLIASTDVEVIENILSAGVYDPRNLKNQNLLFPVDEDLQFRHLIRFNHNWNLPNIGASLTFIDPDGTFERDFLAKGKLLSSKLASVLGTFPKKSFGGGTSTGIGQVLPESVEDLPSSTAEEQPLGKIYIAYGYGTDFETWSGPHSFFVATSRIDYSDKARTITLELTPISNAGAGIILPLENPVSIEGISPIFALTDGITPGTKHERPGMEGLALDRARFADRYHQENAGDLFGVPPADLNNYIMTALENYARSAFGTGDILLLLPDLVANNAQGFCDDHAQSIYRHAKLGISESETFDQYGNLRGTHAGRI